MSSIKILGCEVVEMTMLKGMDIAIKQGGKLFVWPGFQFPSEFKYIEVPTCEEWEKELMKPKEETVQSTISMRIEYLFEHYFNTGFYFPYL